MKCSDAVPPNGRQKALDLALVWKGHDENTLGDLIERLQQMTETDQEKIWEAIIAWIKQKLPSDERRAALRERIRVYAFTRRGRQLPAQLKRYASEVQRLLEPADLIAKYNWLFEKQWVGVARVETTNESYQPNTETWQTKSR